MVFVETQRYSIYIHTHNFFVYSLVSSDSEMISNDSDVHHQTLLEATPDSPQEIVLDIDEILLGYTSKMSEDDNNGQENKSVKDSTSGSVSPEISVQRINKVSKTCPSLLLADKESLEPFVLPTSVTNTMKSGINFNIIPDEVLNIKL